MKITDPQIINLALEMGADVGLNIYKDTKKEAFEVVETFSKMLDLKYVIEKHPTEPYVNIRIGDIFTNINIIYKMSKGEVKEYYLEKAKNLEKEE